MKKLLIALSGVMISLSAHAETPQVKKYLTDFYVLEDLCRGGAGDPQLTLNSCDARDKVSGLLKANGMCYGQTGNSSAQYKWEPCRTKALPQAKAQPAKLAVPWNSGMDWYVNTAQQCQTGDRVSCQQAADTAQNLRGVGWCASGIIINPCPGHVVVSQEEWKANQAKAQRGAVQKPNPNNRYVQAVKAQNQEMMEWVEAMSYYQKLTQ